MSASFAEMRNGMAMPLRDVPQLAPGTFAETIGGQTAAGSRVCAYFVDWPGGSPRQVHVVLADDAAHRLLVARTTPEAGSLASLTDTHPQFHLFEREIAEQSGIAIKGHPRLRPVRILVTDERRDDGPAEIRQTHEVAVGPVHAGVIEPGHFRFQCLGEQVLDLEISLGYQHRGIEEALSGGPHRATLKQIEAAAGDTTAGHTWAYCQNLEALGGIQISERSRAIRAIALELERLANHAGDLGALANDVGFLPTASYCGRIRGDLLNLTAALCGNRFSRGLIVPGGVRFDIDDAGAGTILRRIREIRADLETALGLLFGTASVLSRFEGAGALTRADAAALGLVGVAARSIGLERDVRADHAECLRVYRGFKPRTTYHGDVHARAYLRRLEIKASLEFIAAALRTLPAGPVRAELPSPAPEMLAVSLIEGWRGEICHVAITDPQGKFARYKIVDPSFHNWIGLSIAMRTAAISDFPLCNKSFNLSYCGHDL